MNTRLIPLLCCLLLASVAGCGGDDDDGDGGGAQTSEPPADTRAGTAPSGDTVAVGMKDIQFVPKNVKVKVGDTVEWTNSDSVTHTVTKQAGPGPKFDSGNLDVGAKFKRKFDTPGKVDYVCTIHPNQTGTVTVGP